MFKQIIRRHLFVTSIFVLLIVAFSSTSVGAQHLPRMKWNDRAYEAVTKWLARLDREDPSKLMVFVDCDNTVWAGDIEEAMLRTALKHGYTTEEKLWGLYGDTVPLREGESIQERAERLYRTDFLISYDRASMALAGLTLNQLQEIFELAKKEGRLPRAYSEVKTVLTRLMDRGITVGFISASIFFNVPPMLEEIGYDVPMWQMEGLDIFVEDPGNKKRGVLLSNLVQSKGIRTWKGLLRRYGRLKILARLSGVANTREGKSAGSLSVAARYVHYHNRKRRSSPINMSDLRLAGVFGDNFAPHSDLPGANPRLAGNDQGMVRSLPFIDDALVLNIYRATKKAGKVDLKVKGERNRNFLNLVKQLRSQRTNAVFANQVGIYKGKDRGFDPMEIPRSMRP